jgi:hypothetical protein
MRCAAMMGAPVGGGSRLESEPLAARELEGVGMGADTEVASHEEGVGIGADTEVASHEEGVGIGADTEDWWNSGELMVRLIASTCSDSVGDLKSLDGPCSAVSGAVFGPWGLCILPSRPANGHDILL